jgi:NADPH:quinone reductase-like Zn-dependent oxidoreductase
VELRGGSTERIVTIADYPGAERTGVLFSGGGASPRSPEFLAGLAEQAADGDLRIMIGATYPLERAAEAHRVSESGHGRGKLVLTVG